MPASRGLHKPARCSARAVPPCQRLPPAFKRDHVLVHDRVKPKVALAILTMLVMLTAVLDGTTAAARRDAPTKASCEHPSSFDRAPGVGGPEVIGSGSGARLWGLIMARHFPPVASKAVVKIVWHMTGAGALKEVGYTFHGKSLPLAWGPQLHGGSNYACPGIEWGAGYRFRTPGCYRLTARRTHGSATVWLRIKR